MTILSEAERHIEARRGKDNVEGVRMTGMLDAFAIVNDRLRALNGAHIEDWAAHIEALQDEVQEAVNHLRDTVSSRGGEVLC